MIKILVADDDDQMRELVRMILVQNGYEVVVAEDGEKALQVARAEKPELVVLDLAMPRKNGYEVCKALRADPEARISKMKVVVTSGKNYPMDKRVAHEVGADLYLTKPYPEDELLGAIGRLLGQPPSRP